MKVVFWDTESTGLTGIMGRLLCSSYVDLEGNLYTHRQDDEDFLSVDPIYDGHLAVAIREELERFDLIVAHNGRLHDIPLLNARLAKCGERPLRTHFVLDPRWYLNGSQMKIGSAKLDNAAKYFNLAEQKTLISWDTWQRAAALDTKAMDEVVEHCEADVLTLRELYPIVLPYVATLHK